jgi:hypothetical protein
MRPSPQVYGTKTAAAVAVRRTTLAVLPPLLEVVIG